MPTTEPRLTWIQTAPEPGDVYVADSYNHRIQELGPTGLPLAEWGGRGGEVGQLRRPEGLIVDDAGGMVVVDADNDRLQRYEPSAGS